MLGVGEAVGSTVGVAVGSCWLAVARARPWLAVTYPSTTRAPATVITAATPATPRPMRCIWFIAGLLLHRPSRPSIGMAVACCGRSIWLTTTLDCGSGTTVERRWSNDELCDLVHSQRPWHLSLRITVPSGSRHVQQRAAGRDHPADRCGAGGPGLAREHLYRVRLEDKVEGTGPLSRQLKRIGARVIHPGLRKPRPAASHGRRCDVKGHYLIPVAGQQLRVVAVATTHHQGPISLIRAPGPGGGLW